MKLQKDLTTPEQSMRLLALGVPADSADGFYSRESYRGGKWEYPKLFESDKDKVDFKSVYEGGVSMYLPLFTVGRLIEIFFKSSKYTYILLYPQFNQIDFLMSLFEEKIKAHKLDFSKLEE